MPQLALPLVKATSIPKSTKFDVLQSTFVALEPVQYAWYDEVAFVAALGAAIVVEAGNDVTFKEIVILLVPESHQSDTNILTL